MFLVGELGATITADASDFTKKLDRVADEGQKRMRSLGKTMKAAITAPLTAMAGLSVKAFDTQIQAEKRLEAQLKATGEEVRNNMADFKEFASGLQEITTVGDESTLKLLQVSKSMGLTNDQAKRASQNAIGLAKAMDMNEQSAIRYAAALEQGNTTMLARYIPALREIDDESQRAAKAQELLGNMFSAATSEAEVGLGPLKQIKNTLGDFSEEIGEIILHRLKPLIGDLRSTVDWFKNLDQGAKETIVTVGGLAAAIGPATFGLGWAIRLTIPAVKTLTKSIRTLTAAMVANPYLAVGAAIASIGTLAYFTEQHIARFHDEIQKVFDTADEWQTVNDKIADVENRMNELADAARLVGVSPEQNKEFVELRNQLERLVEMRDRLVSEELQLNIQMDALEDARALMSFINTDFSEFATTAEQANIARPFVELEEVADKIIPSLDQINQGFQELSAQEIMTNPITDLPGKMFPPGSVGFMQQSLENLRTQLRAATDPENIEGLQDKINNLKNRISELTGETEGFGEATSLTSDAVKTAFQSMSDASISSFEELGKVVVNTTRKIVAAEIAAGIATTVKKALTSVPFPLNIAAAAAAGASAAGLFNAIVPKFHEGGIVGGNGEQPILAKAGEGVFTKRQMQAMGGMMRGEHITPSSTSDQQITQLQMQRAFERAMDKKLQKLGPNEIWEMGQRGRAGY